MMDEDFELEGDDSRRAREKPQGLVELCQSFHLVRVA
jgi:hypothetical protein